MILAMPGGMKAGSRQVSLSVEQIQRQLKADEVMLEYFLTDSSAEVNAISQESSFFVNQSLDQIFWCSLRTFRKKMKSAEPSDFLFSGEVLYLFLIKPIEDFLAGRHRLIIIPDERLTGLPFEAFIRSDDLAVGAFGRDLHYLIHDFEVVYHSSRECWNESALRRMTGQTDTGDFQFAFIGFSPAFSHNKNSAALPRSKTEIAEIGEMFRQTGLSARSLGDACTGRECFKKMACLGKIVHLATHCIPPCRDRRESGFFICGQNHDGGKNRLWEGLLSGDDIEAMNLKADLIVLNACGSGDGSWKSDILPNSFPLIFIKAGARNIISTLWNVNDNLAGDFMRDFYRSWLSGKSYSQALREVKLQWISCRETTIPTIWAPYVLMGE